MRISLTPIFAYSMKPLRSEGFARFHLIDGTISPWCTYTEKISSCFLLANSDVTQFLFI